MSLINIKNLTFAYEDSYEYLFENVNFQIDSNWKLGLQEEMVGGKQHFLICY